MNCEMIEKMEAKMAKKYLNLRTTAQYYGG